MAQVDSSIHQVIELNRQKTVEVEKFVKLLAELKIIDIPDYIGETASRQEVELPIESLPLQVCEAYLDLVESSSKFTYSTSEEPEILAEYTPLNPENLDLDINVDNYEDGIVAFQRLQDILVGAEITELEDIATNLQEKLAKLEYQIYEPEALIELLLPCFAELLRLKINESQAEIVHAIAPIIDSAIQSRIEQNKNSMSQALAPALPDAISQQITIAPEEISNAIAPTMGRAMKKQIEIEKDAIVDALYPIIGSTISKYMAETIHAINKQVEETFSVEGIKRKIRAKLQGVTEAELILKEALPFTIEAIFLIHKASGLIITDIQPSDVQQLESEMIAGMLTAIRSFANDCINHSGNVSELDAIDYGTSKIILEVAGYCYLAIVVRGEPTIEFIHKMRQTLIKLLKKHGDSIEKFDGDLAVIPSEVHTVLSTLKADSQTENLKNRPSPVLLLSATLLSAILIPWGIWQYRSAVIHAAENKTAIFLASTPELAVYRLNVQENRGKLKITGNVPNQVLRSKAEQVASLSNPKWSIDNQILAVEVPPDPVLAAAEVERVTAILNQMDGVAISAKYIHNKVSVEGIVNLDKDVTKIIQAFEQIPGVKLVSSVVQVKPLLINLRFYFGENSANLIQADLTSKIQQVKVFLTENPMKNLKIIGFSYSSTGEPEVALLALQRAEAVKKALISRGIEPSRLQVIGKTNFPPGIDVNQPLWLKRCVILEAINK